MLLKRETLYKNIGKVKEKGTLKNTVELVTQKEIVQLYQYQIKIKTLIDIKDS